MTMICGIELKSSEAIIAIVNSDDGQVGYVDTDPKRIQIADDENVADVQSFFDAFRNFLRDNHIEQLVIKKRAKRGQMAGGAVTFKLEGLIQLNGTVPIDFISGQTIAAYQKRHGLEIPAALNRYQEQAYLAAIIWANQR
ncbi:DUF3010 family protein [Aeromonas veronii]|uniref:DUF3010 family protein n=1 Tax=Aeromonas veronii TaxID=654 RepID=UPI00143106D5|nr:DUF3010 family protein [Aeromonas veronii]MBJ7589495.1 DUF3010 family protein [Aeromonas veronii]NJI21544.1 DUF3010 family protein [Aeromonas veronii]NJI35055.1 DUF3010 family protein [Aeromonas veronii]